MNQALVLKGHFKTQKHPKAIVVHSLPKGNEVTSEQLNKIRNQLIQVLDKWNSDNLLGSALISVHYNRIIPKSKRISTLLKDKGIDVCDCIRGAKFEDDENDHSHSFNKRHVFTYVVSTNAIKNSIDMISKCIGIIDTNYSGKIDSSILDDINRGNWSSKAITKNNFAGILTDCDVIHHIEVDEFSESIDESNLISLYKTDIPTKDILRKIGINITDDRMLDDCTVNLNRNEINILQSRAPYLIAMVNDFSKYDFKPSTISINDAFNRIPSPNNEPYIGVIDTQFDKSVYFGNWVDYHNEMNAAIQLSSEDYIHGTEVTSIIVDGPNIDPRLEDGCGRFRVKHFGVATAKSNSSFQIIKKIKGIIKSNLDIKVWNLSLGAILESPENFISAEAAILDQIQSMYDVIIIISGTNDNDKTGNKRIGAPADSINSLVVNSVTSNGKATSYARKGPVLGFFYKPDVSAYGGDTGDFMRVCGPLGENLVSGTSYAAPWISRKIAFLIHKMGLSREVAKALIIDAAAEWSRKDNTNYNIGYGIVPVHIKDILETREDEIKFVISGTINEYETYNYTLPVPIYNGLQPFWARATMAYYPYCDRNQGVDYTSTEVDLHFGRVFIEKGQVKIKEINNNKQANDGVERIYEKNARLVYRKWDNVKYIAEKPDHKSRPKKVYESGMWGLRIISKERGVEKKGNGLHFGVVITLREMNGVNRINEFIKLCNLYGWLVTPIDIDNSLNIYNKTDEDIQWE